MVAPITLGKINEYKLTTMFIKWMINKYINYANGKKRLFRRSRKALIFLHEPMSLVDQKAYEDIMFLMGYNRGISEINSETILCNLASEQAIWSSDNKDNKLDCAIEVTKDNTIEYARFAYEKFKNDCKRWGVELQELTESEVLP